MSTTPNPVQSMVNDPEFQKLQLVDQRRALSGVDKDFGALSDADVTRVIGSLRSAPQTQVPDAVAQSRALLASKIQPQPTSSLNRWYTQETTVPNDPYAIAKGIVPAGSTHQESPRSAIANTGKMAAAMTLPATAITAPIATGVGIAGGTAGSLVGGYAGRKVGEKFNSPDVGQDVGETIGGGIGAGLAANSSFTKWLSSSKSAGAALLQQASAKAGNAPVEISPRTDEIVEKIATQSKLGGKMPKVISDLLERVGPSIKTPAQAPPNPLTYDEARILQSNASQLSAEESQQFKGSLKGLLKQFANSFSQDVQQAADKAGVGTEHAQGMKEYAVAASRNRALTKAAKIVGIGSGIGLAEEAVRRGVKAAVQ